jgi:hypothetical protein
VLYADGSASGGAVTVELVTAEGPREIVSGTRGLTLYAVGPLDPEHADMLLVPDASDRVGEPGGGQSLSRQMGGGKGGGLAPCGPGETKIETDRRRIARRWRRCAGRPAQEVGAGARKQDEFIPILPGRTLTTALPALLKQTMDDPDITLVGDRITWKQATTKPMRLNMTFDATLNGDTLQGTSKAGRLSSSKETGERRTTLEHQA